MKLSVGDSIVNISEGNMKMGKVSSFSVMPGKTCAKGVPCKGECYALRMFNYRPTLRKTWEQNTCALIFEDPQEIAEVIAAYINGSQVRYFRWNVGGDFNLKGYFEMTLKVAELCPGTKFLAFTKCFEYRLRKRPKNYSLILSFWKDFKIKTTSQCGIAYFDDGTYPIPSDAVPCEGNCEECGYCFNAKRGSKIVFKKH